ncbi:hypothetical protein PWEIH_13740 [Listeria weihenstephanensis FSL R9-0317]|uniref:Uncharacterized protein n=1 Tax=Listeria weihenstephanensis TaxID=1006155 RepID=A0A1S7FUH6_9LIST|nr:hypothetical protein [Listeria weihenstephanensis]AQY51106.1 hypothetical protein UE46_08650 [Listeria weihenstephanensis]EUJ36530.1 hypothetical protein PWEIH_13740 [Listeria weihenstephanensis FSL R9-0317]MBC1500098.1 hypothetical protein [Listeria weihenstephanensis]
MFRNGFTYVLCLYITLLGITVMLGATSIYSSKLQMEKQLQNHYLANTLLNISIHNNLSKIKSSQKTFTESHNEAILWYNWADSTEDSIKYNTVTKLKNGYILNQIIYWDIKSQKIYLLLN